MDMFLLVLLVLGVIYAPRYTIVAAGYLVQKFKFGNSFKEVYNHHKEQDARERKTK